MDVAQECTVGTVSGPTLQDADPPPASQCEAGDVERIGSSMFAALATTAVDVAAGVAADMVNLRHLLTEEPSRFRLHLMDHPEPDAGGHLARHLIEDEASPCDGGNTHAVLPTATVAGDGISDWQGRDMWRGDDGTA